MYEQKSAMDVHCAVNTVKLH